MQAESKQTFRVIMSLLCRVALLAIALPVFLRHFPNYKPPHRYPTDWIIVTVCDGLAVAAPLMRLRKLAFLAGAAALAAHSYYRHFVPVWDLAYMAVAILFVLQPSSHRQAVKQGPRTR
ncbi:MAG: hypothetical protein ACLGXA_10785 [Acidobacteriota bacterium]